MLRVVAQKSAARAAPEHQLRRLVRAWSPDVSRIRVFIGYMAKVSRVCAVPAVVKGLVLVGGAWRRPALRRRELPLRVD